MSNDIYENIKKEFEERKNPTPIYDSLTNNIPVKAPLYKRIFNYKFRIWIYSISFTLTIAYAIWSKSYEISAISLPFIMAIFFVGKDGNTK